jgi:hypothetical protein
VGILEILHLQAPRRSRPMQSVPRPKLIPPSVAGEFELEEIERPMSSIGRICTRDGVEGAGDLGICVSQ